MSIRLWIGILIVSHGAFPAARLCAQGDRQQMEEQGTLTVDHLQRRTLPAGVVHRWRMGVELRQYVEVEVVSVSDEVTEELMKRFYTHWLDGRDGPSKAEALRRAQEDVRGTAGWEHPRFWAAFQLVGAE